VRDGVALIVVRCYLHGLLWGHWRSSIVLTLLILLVRRLDGLYG
jgi:hypothetical protein